jgi:hypothetical protein
VTIGSHYAYEYKDIKIDPYRVLHTYGICNPAQQHAIKKLLRAGHSVKSTEEDVKEVIVTLQRWLEMMQEDS